MRGARLELPLTADKQSAGLQAAYSARPVRKFERSTARVCRAYITGVCKAHVRSAFLSMLCSCTSVAHAASTKATQRRTTHPAPDTRRASVPAASAAARLAALEPPAPTSKPARTQDRASARHRRRPAHRRRHGQLRGGPQRAGLRAGGGPGRAPRGHCARRRQHLRQRRLQAHRARVRGGHAALHRPVL